MRILDGKICVNVRDYTALWHSFIMPLKTTHTDNDKARYDCFYRVTATLIVYTHVHCTCVGSRNWLSCSRDTRSVLRSIVDQA